MKEGKSPVFDPRIYCDYPQLVRLQAQGERMLGLEKHSASILSGRHASQFRGRGLNFEELRHYQFGDDIRNVDWKTTRRMGKPYVRCYTEEKDQNVILCVDQRCKMFFSSVETMKSVAAAEVASLLAWRILKDGDRLGWIIAGCDQIVSSKASRCKPELLRNLKQLSEANQALNLQSMDAPEVSFSHILRSASRLNLKASTLVIVSDWSDYNDQDLKCLLHLQRHNNVLSIIINDPLELSIPDAMQHKPWVMGDGVHQLQLDSRTKIVKTNQQLLKQSKIKRQQLSRLMAVQHLPLLALDTGGQHLMQLIRAMGGR